jgi:hypothetical protein
MNKHYEEIRRTNELLDSSFHDPISYSTRVKYYTQHERQAILIQLNLFDLESGSFGRDCSK